MTGLASLLAASARGSCPRCGSRTLFSAVATFAPRCRACGLDFAAFNVGDGPAAFLTLIVGGAVTLLAVLLEVAAEPPFWVHVLLWLPLATVGVLLSLRVGKAVLLTLEYRHRPTDEPNREPTSLDRKLPEDGAETTHRP